MNKTALLSVFYKDGIVDFARALVELGWSILASGGTAKALQEGGIEVRDIAEIVGKPILGHRVVTLSREVHAMLLAQDTPEDNAELAEMGLSRIDLVCVDLYPLEDAIAKEGATRGSIIEMTDVGGPTMLHSAAKGERIVICDPVDRFEVIAQLQAGDQFQVGETISPKFKDYLAAKADATVARYCLAASRWRSAGHFDGWIGERVQICKYGENPWQEPAALYRTFSSDAPEGLPACVTVEGDLPSYVNWTDVDRLFQTVTHIAAGFARNSGVVPKIAVGVKHGNPCGAAVAEDDLEATRRMVEGSPLALHGGLVMVNYPVDKVIAEILLWHKTEERRLLDGIIAPSFTEEAKEMLARKKGKCRLIESRVLTNLSDSTLDRSVLWRPVSGGSLKQPNYIYIFEMAHAAFVNGELTAQEHTDVLLACAVGATSNSNTVTIAKDGQVIGNGVGQQSRVEAADLAVRKARLAGHDTKGGVAYSDSFFPFKDGPQMLADAGISVILASSGSLRDQEVKDYCAAMGMKLLMVPDKQARGFFNH